MGNTLPAQRYAQLAQGANDALTRAQCSTVQRAAMFLAQVGHESAGLRYTEEIASGAAYENRADLGNTRKGDGVRFKGRSFIQITGRHNYTRLSSWAHRKGYVDAPDYFTAAPAKLADDEHAWLGPVWYWTVARDMNVYADAQDLEAATRAVNGALHGLDSRRTYYQRCLRLGAAILPTMKVKPMAAEYAPDAIKAMFNTVQAALPQARLGGILGDRSHSYGYHRGAAFVAKTDYSVQRPDDRHASVDKNAAAALDLTMPPAQMKLVTSRLIRATKARDPRMRHVREFFGTVNGTTVTGMDTDGRWVSSDPSHLWHVHVSVYRRFANDHAALQLVAGVIIGTPRKGQDLDAKQTEELIAQAFRAYHQGGKHGPFTPEKYGGWIKDEKNGVGDRLVRLEKKP
jgi:putative chitinase